MLTEEQAAAVLEKLAAGWRDRARAGGAAAKASLEALLARGRATAGRGAARGKDLLKGESLARMRGEGAAADAIRSERNKVYGARAGAGAAGLAALAGIGMGARRLARGGAKSGFAGMSSRTKALIGGGAALAGGGGLAAYLASREKRSSYELLESWLQPGTCVK
jgi:hypothetical protein